MNLLIISLQGVSLSLHEKIKQEGHEAIFHIVQEDCRDIGEGMIWKTDDPDALADQADIIFFDDNGGGMGEMADRYHKKGYTVFGGGTFVEKLEHDRLFGQKVFKEHGIPTPETWEVSDLASVKAVLKEEFGKGERLVIKLDGADMAGSSFSFVAKNPEECLAQVQHWIDDGMLPGKWSGIIQRFIEGTEVSCSAWWNGEEFSTHCIDLEEKKPFPGNLGPAVGCATNLIVRIDPSSRLFKQVLEPVAPLLRKSGYVGEIDTNSIVDSKGVPHALEWTPRQGWDSTPTFAYGNSHGFFNKIGLITGLIEEPEEFGYQGRYWFGVRVGIPPYPAECPDEEASKAFYEACCQNVPCLNYEELKESFYPYDLKKEGPHYKCAGAMAVLGVANGAGATVAEAAKAAYKVAEKVEAPNKIFRAVDGYKRAEKAMEELLATKLIKPYPRLP